MDSPRIVLPLFLVTFQPHVVFAAGSSGETGEALPTVGAGLYLQTFVGLAVVLGLIVAFGWLMRRYGQLPNAGKGAMKVLGGVSLGTRERAVLLEVEGARLLLGVAPGNVRMLHVIKAVEAQGEEPVSFSTALKDNLQTEE